MAVTKRRGEVLILEDRGAGGGGGDVIRNTIGHQDTSDAASSGKPSTQVVSRQDRAG